MKKTLLIGTAIVALALAFIASYAAALHDPTPHAVPVAAASDVPASVLAKLDRDPALKLIRTDDPAGALDRRDAYATVTVDRGELTLTTAPAASATIATQLQTALPDMRHATAHPLPQADSRGLVGTYTVIGWVIAGYLGATLYGLALGTRERLGQRLAGLAGVSVAMGAGGALIAQSIGGLPGSFLAAAGLGTLIVAAAGSVATALQSLFGIVGTGIAILLFVVLGNPSSGGLAAPELLPGFWRAIGQLLPVGAGVTGLRDLAYFPAASIAVPLLTLAAWLAAGLATLAAQAAISGAIRSRRSASSSSLRTSRGRSRSARAASDVVVGAPEPANP